MAKRFTVYFKNSMLDSMPSSVFLSVHNGDPGDGGLNEIPTTTREPATLLPASAGVRLAVETYVDFSIPANGQVDYVGFFDAATGGNFIASSTADGSMQAFPWVFRATNILFDLTLEVA